MTTFKVGDIVMIGLGIPNISLGLYHGDYGSLFKIIGTYGCLIEVASVNGDSIYCKQGDLTKYYDQSIKAIFKDSRLPEFKPGPTEFDIGDLVIIKPERRGWHDGCNYPMFIDGFEDNDRSVRLTPRTCDLDKIRMRGSSGFFKCFVTEIQHFIPTQEKPMKFKIHDEKEKEGPLNRFKLFMVGDDLKVCTVDADGKILNNIVRFNADRGTMSLYDSIGHIHRFNLDNDGYIVIEKERV